MLITELGTTNKPVKWRDELLPAMFRGAPFYCDSGSWEGGTRIVEHEFPKKDMPYAENMGRKAVTLSVRGYCICYPFDIGGLHVRDYRKPRDALKLQLDAGAQGLLQIPGLPGMIVYCQRYRLTEEDKLGGFCTFDMTFVETGSPVVVQTDASLLLKNRSAQLRQQIQIVLSQRTNTRLGPPPRPSEQSP